MVETWDGYFAKQFELEWPIIKEALASAKQRHFSLSIKPQIGFVELENHFWIPVQTDAIETSSEECYHLDGASFFSVMNLNVEDDDRIVDLCSAPGGKALCIMHLWPGVTGTLLCNEPSDPRKRRLEKVLRELGPVSRPAIKVSSVEATNYMTLGSYGTFGKCFVDAPCSSDKHLLSKPHFLSKWSPKTPINNATRQLEILKSSFKLLGEEGKVVYSTCALSSVENDDVVSKLMKVAAKEGTNITVQQIPEESVMKRFNLEDVSEDSKLMSLKTKLKHDKTNDTEFTFTWTARRTAHGVLFLPDLPGVLEGTTKSTGEKFKFEFPMGPLFVCSLLKNM